MEYCDRIKAHLLSNMIIDEKTGCWLWQRCDNGMGYGQLSYNGKQELVHRISWNLFKGPIPDGLWVLHRCDIKLCFNPEHLFLGTDQDNKMDAKLKGLYGHQVITHCKHGHEFTSDNTYAYRTQTGIHRMCRVCRKQYGKEYYQELKNGAE